METLTKEIHDSISDTLWITADSDVTTTISNNGTGKQSLNKKISDRKPKNTSVIVMPILSPEEADPFYYGWRYEQEYLSDGTYQLRQIGLPPERFLDPQEGDQFVQSEFHNTVAGSIQECYKNRYKNDNTIRVFGDVKIAHGISDMAAPAPNVSVVPNCTREEEYRGTFNVQEEGTHPMLVIEVASPRYPFDRQKIPIYERVGIQEYIIVDPHWNRKNTELKFFGYHLVNGRYQSMIKDEQGRLYNATTDTYLFFEADENGKVTEHITDGTTGERLLNSEQADRERLIHAIGRHAAEARANAEAVERQAAEEQAQAEAAARQAAEQRAQAAEERAKAEVAERQAVEENMAKMLAELAHLKALLAQQSKNDK